MKKKIIACLVIALVFCGVGCSRGNDKGRPTEDTKPTEVETTADETVGKDAEVVSSEDKTSEKKTTEEKTTKPETTKPETTKPETTKAETTTKAEVTTEKQTTTKVPETTTKQSNATTGKQNDGNPTQNAPTNKPSGAVMMEISTSATSNNIAEKIISQIITADMSEYERVKAIHDWIVINVQYDYAGLQGDTLTKTDYNVDGALYYKVAVCQGYAEAFHLLCAKAGIQSHIMYGEAGNAVDGWDSHAWNVVRINGEWYQVDCTWDDPLVNGEVVTGRENLIYTYFLLTDQEMYYDHRLDAEYTENEKVCTSTLFYGYAKYLTLDEQLNDSSKDTRVTTGAQAQEAAKKFIKNKVYNFRIAVPEKITNATEFIQQGICDGLVANGIEGNIQLGYAYQQVFDYIIYEVTVTLN